jgi:hypothetical protein
MSTKETLKSPGRRAFFQKAGVGAAGVAAVGLAGKSAEAAVQPDKDFKKSAYRETEHVKRYYELSRD